MQPREEINMSDEKIQDAVAAMLDGNRVKFGELVADLMADKADAAVAAFRDEYAPTAFAFEEDADAEEEVVEDEEAEGETEEEEVA